MFFRSILIVLGLLGLSTAAAQELPQRVLETAATLIPGTPPY